MFFIIIYAARANAFVRGLGDPLSMGNALAVVFTIIMIFKHRVKFTKNYLISIFILIIYTIITFIVHSYVSGGFIPRWFIYLTIAYVICQIYGERIYALIESALLPLILISMGMWVLHLMFPDVIHTFVESVSLPSFSDNPDYMTYNCIFYTINGEEDRVLSDYFMFKRNAGFAWEPGAYATLACLGISCSLIRNPNRLISVSMVIYLAAIATSQSTTGVFILASILLVWVIINKKYLWAILLVPVALYVFGLSFVGDKFVDEYTDISLAAGNLNNAEYHGRLFGLEASLVEFMQHPIIGLGGKQETYLLSTGMDAAIFSGLGFLLTRFGLLLSVVFFIILFKSEKNVRCCFNNRGGFCVIVTIALSMISYSMWEQPLFLALAFMSVYGSFNCSQDKA